MMGSRFGPYEITASLGAGGMGEVYRARDTRLGRDVAIKVLPAALAADPARLRRFEQEARAASALNHPNILVVYDVGTHERRPYLVEELLEGRTLRERLGEGALPVRKAVEIAAQVAQGLAAAHGRGIVHRDLKPENLFVTRDGVVKILDFGLAKLAADAAPPPEQPAISVTPTETAPGVVLGTVGYMAPEQVRGEPADHRSDLFALGCVLYEMLAGTPPFRRGSAVETMHAILKEELPDLTTADARIPPGLVRLVQHCLEKEPGDRFEAARDLAFDLQTLTGTANGEGRAGLGTRRPPLRGRARDRLLWGIGAAVVGVAIGALLATRWSRRPLPAEPVRFAVTAPEGGTLVTDVTSTAISPDGRRLVFTVMDAAGTSRLWVRSLDSLAAQPLSGTEGATFPFWSPDSRSVAFFAQGKLHKVAVSGGPPEVICAAPDARGGSWGRDGVIVFAPVSLGPLLKVSAEGGEAVEVARPDPARGETGLRFPCFLPDGRHFLFVTMPRRREGFDVGVSALDGAASTRVLPEASAPVYAEPGYLLFALGDRLVAQRFDLSTLRPVGNLVPLGVAPPVSTFDGGNALSASVNGVLAHSAASPPLTELVWLDRAGRETGRIPLPPGSYSNPSLSPNGRWAAVTRFNSSMSYDLWLVDLQRAVTTRLTFDGLVAAGGMNSPVVWSPDSSRVAYTTMRSGLYDVYEVAVSGTGRPEPLVQSNVVYKLPAAWSPDGKYFIFTQIGKESQYDLWLLPQQGNRSSVPYLRTPFSEDACAVSPDGRWLAFDSDETGTYEIYVRSFPVPGEKVRVSTSGGRLAQWSRDGKELLFFSPGQYFSGTGPIYVVNVQTKPTFTAGTPRVLFTPRPDISGLAPTPDLARFLVTAPAEGAAPASITITLDWPATVRQ
jgi:Tol biopolymer transport system component